ncbi:MurR/RpiR family transcriptional regulator [Fusibacter ferrireducens]|uniref:MurR/RpiR family transcriptional regulator n=1 Tax=Fusibacter ferrireducens TaxID=2785058 RepID=A0ABR9ZUM8_9FIRM|nr:MurR/RpiR family transcriptional regulator [Fusibacter ferrireducens]MBF4694167.1 MurR/RpiR family transcriptional regulator [Fusibacter ferrireducens]
MGLLLQRLLIVLNDEDYNSTPYYIAMTMLNNFYLINELTISELAKLCNVSKSTISKFIREIGFEDYTDFRVAAPFIENRYKNELNYNTNVMGYMSEKGLEGYFEAIIGDIKDYWHDIDMDKIDELAKDLVDYKIVASFGLMYSESAAIDFQTKLAYNKKFIITKLSDVKQDEFIENAGEDTLIIIFTNSGNYIKKYQITEGNLEKSVFDRTRAKVVVITSNKEMEQDPRVDLCVLFKHTSKMQTHPIMFQIISDLIVHRYRLYSKGREKL